MTDKAVCRLVLPKRVEAHILGSIAAANVFNEKNSPNIIFWSSEVVPAPCLTDFGLDHS